MKAERRKLLPGNGNVLIKVITTGSAAPRPTTPSFATQVLAAPLGTPCYWWITNAMTGNNANRPTTSVAVNAKPSLQQPAQNMPSGKAVPRTAVFIPVTNNPAIAVPLHCPPNRETVPPVCRRLIWSVPTNTVPRHCRLY